MLRQVLHRVHPCEGVSLFAKTSTAHELSFLSHEVFLLVFSPVVSPYKILGFRGNLFSGGSQSISRSDGDDVHYSLFLWK